MPDIMFCIYSLKKYFHKNFNHSRDHFLPRFRGIFACFLHEIAYKFPEWEKNRTSNVSHFTPQSLFFALAVLFETFALFYMISFLITFAPLFVSYTIAGSQSLRSVLLERFVVKITCRSLVFFFFFFFFFPSISPSLH